MPAAKRRPIDEFLYRTERGPLEARVKHGPDVWVLVRYLRAVDGDVSQAAEDYQIPEDAVRAALDFYRAHKKAIDGRIAVDEAS